MTVPCLSFGIQRRDRHGSRCRRPRSHSYFQDRKQDVAAGAWYKPTPPAPYCPTTPQPPRRIPGASKTVSADTSIKGASILDKPLIQEAVTTGAMELLYSRGHFVPISARSPSSFCSKRNRNPLRGGSLMRNQSHLATRPFYGRVGYFSGPYRNGVSEVARFLTCSCALILP
jgi:hypothetical protein